MTSLAFALSLTFAAQFPVPTPPPAEAPVEKVADKPAPPPSGPCATPRRVLETWLGNLQPDQYNEGAAIRCFQKAGLSSRVLRQRAVRLKRVLDARGVFVRVEDVADDHDYRDEKGNAKVTFTKQVPHMTIVAESGEWRLSKEAIKAIPGLYSETFPFDIDRVLEDLPAWSKVNYFGVTPWQLAALILLFALGLLVRAIVAKLVSSQVLRVMRKLNMTWGQDLIHGSSLPLGTLALAGVLAAFVPSLGLSVRWAQVSLLGVRVIAAVSLVLLLYRLVDVLTAYMVHRAAGTDTKLDDQLVPLVRRGLKIVIVVLGALFVLQNLEVDITSILATFGVGTIAFALAAKDTVQNLFGSLTIFLDKPFQIGDWVQTCGVEGIIEEVGFRSTRVRTFYNSQVTVPNGKFTDAIVDNYGRRQYRRCSIKLGLTYDTTPEQMEAFCDGLRAIIAAHPATRKDYYEVHFAGYGASSLDVMLYFFFDVDSWTKELRARHEVYLDFLRLAQDLGVSYAFPTQSLHIESHREQIPYEAHSSADKEKLARTVEDYGPGGDHHIEPGRRVHPEGFYSKGADPFA
jgi:MscS family membrane protein